MEHMYIVRSIVGICVQAGGVAASTAVLPKIFFEVLPNLMELLVAAPVEPDAERKLDGRYKGQSTTVPVLAALLEIISLLIGLLPVLSPDVIRKYFFGYSPPSHTDKASTPTQPTTTDKKTTVLTILNRLPLPRLNDILEQNRDSDDSIAADGTTEQERAHIVQSCVEFRQRHNVHLELCRLIAVATTYSGPSVAINCVLPAVNSFFDSFVLTYETLDVESDEMSLAFEIGVELFFPLAQLVGPEAFNTAVPHLNPRLEMWLVSSASDEVGRSPPLPSNILPAEQASGNSDETITPVKGSKGFFSWFSSKGSDSPAMKKLAMQQEEDSSFFVTPAKFMGSSLDSIKKSATEIFASTDSTDEISPAAAVLVEEEMGNVDHAARSQQRKVARQQSNKFARSPGKMVPQQESIPSTEKHAFRPDTARTETYFNNLSMLARTVSHGGKRNIGMSSVGNLFGGSGSGRDNDESSEDEEGDNYNQMQSDMTWLLGGEGRWNAVKEANSGEGGVVVGGGSKIGRPPPVVAASSSERSNSRTKPSFKASSVDLSSTATRASSYGRLVPAAQISNTSPRITVVTASEASAMFGLKMANRTSWPFDNHLPQSTLQPSTVTLLLANQTESILMGGAKDGMIKIWSLSAHPVRQLSGYREHTSSILCANFMRNGSHVASCDGHIHIWDIETTKTLAAIQFSFSQEEKFNHISVVSARRGIAPDMGVHGDDQIAACSGSVITHYDVRMKNGSALKPISEWRMPLVSPLSISATEGPLQLTCSESHEEYVCTGSSTGCLWVIDRRTGRPTHMWQAHDGPIIKVSSPLVKIYLILYTLITKWKLWVL